MNADPRFGMKILIVDDEPVNLVLLREIIEEAGYTELKTISDSRNVLGLFDAYQPDLLLLDLMMPHIDGFEIMQQLAKKISSDNYFPVLVLTADASAATKRRALSVGATDFLTKPFDQTEVLLRINNLLKTRLLHTRLQEHNSALADIVKARTASLERALADLKSAQRQVVQQERLAALGTMAAGVGHDFRNTLMAVLGYTELLLQSIDTIDRRTAAEQLQIVYTAAQDSAKIVERLREFYRPFNEEEPRASIDLNQVLDQVATLTAPKWKTQSVAAGAEIELVLLPGEIPCVSGHVAEFREVMTNLIFNAVDAMPVGGKIVLRTAEREGRVILDIADTGAGMNEEVRQRCLEPFFTTKGVNGTGLGLAVVYGIVQRHGGTISIWSEPGIGTTFSLSFPAVKTNAQTDAPSVGQISRPLRVLVVDDKPVLCQLLIEYLKSDWHTVEVATSGKDALDKFRTTRFDLVITDRVMPGMNGDDLTVRLRAIAPQQPVLMVTGFTNKTALDSAKVVLPKPISLSALRQAISTALAA